MRWLRQRRQRKATIQYAEELEKRILDKIAEGDKRAKAAYDIIKSKEKNEAIAALLSLVVPGAGQIYVGKIGKGLAILGATIVLAWVLIGVFVWLWNIWDAKDEAKLHNAQITIEVARCYGLA